MELPSSEFHFSSKAFEISGLDPSPKPVSLEMVLSRFHKDDRKHAAHILIEARQRCLDELALNVQAFLAGERRNRVC
jgi:hypothetical protein